MKKNFMRVSRTIFHLLALTASLVPLRIKAQSQDSEQLLLDVEKLSQLKTILIDMKQGYLILDSGFAHVSDITEGSYQLHKSYLDGLLAVSPAVRSYPRITDILNDQQEMVTEYQTAYSRFRRDSNFSAGEIAYLGNVYSNLLSRSRQDLSELSGILTADTLRMSDGQRLELIDRIYRDTRDRLDFLRSFDEQTTILAIERARRKKGATTLQGIYGITN